MKPSRFLPLLVGLGLAPAATAQDIIKANNTLALNLPASWAGGVVPGTGNVAVWNGTFSSTFGNTAALGANLSWQGIRIENPYNSGSSFSITGSNTLTLGSSGIDLNTFNLLFGVPVVFNADAELRLNVDSKGITFNGPTNLGGRTLTVVSGHESRFINGVGPFSNGTLRFTSGTHNGHGQFNVPSTGGFNMLGTGGSRIIVNHAAASNPQLAVNLTESSRLSLGIAFDNLSLEIGNLSGTPGTWIVPDYLAATGSPAVVRTLAVNQTIDGTFDGSLVSSNSNRSLGFTKSGNACLALTHPYHIYNGTTTVQAGTLKITGDGALCYRPANNIPLTVGLHTGPVVINNGIFHDDSSISQILSSTLGGTGTLLKTNSSFLTLSGDGSAFTGQITVNNGRLILQNALGGHVTLAPGTSLAGTGTGTGSITTAADTTLVLSGGATTTARAFNGVTLNGPTYFEFLSAPQGGVIYDVISYGAVGITNLNHLHPRARGVLSDDMVNQKLVFTAEAAGVRTWNTGDGIWNNEGLLTNWAGGDQIYMQGDQAIFGAMSATTTITLTGLLSPSVVTVENPANTYTFVGSGGFTGTGTIHKNSSGVLEIGTPNTNFQGTLNINAGIFRLIDGGTWGLSPINNNAALEIEGATDSTFLGNIAGTGTLTKRGSGTVTIGGGPNDLLSTSIIYNNLKVNENSFTGNVVVEGGCLRLNKPTALGISNTGAKTVTVTNGGQIDFNGFAPMGRDNRTASRTYSFRIAGAGVDGTGALVNHRIGLGQFAGVLNLALTADATVGGTANFNAGYYNMGSAPALNGVITGNGHTLTKVGPDQVSLRGPASNLTIIVKEGTLFGEGNSACFGGASGSVTVHTGATLRARGTIFNPVSETGPMIIATPLTFHNGANLRSDESGTIHWAGPITLAGILKIHISVSDHSITGTVGGSGGIVKTGPNILTIAASNTYSGPTTVNEGSVAIQQPYLSDTAAVTVAAGATLQLNFPGTDIVGSLTLGGVAIAPGQTCDAITHPGLLAGTGKIQVANTTSDYINWSGTSGYHLSGGPDGDDDFDGLANFQEYAFGLDPTSGANASPVNAPDRNVSTFTYTRRKPSLTQLVYIYESSTTLAGWDVFTPPAPDGSDNGNPVEIITVTVPAALLAEPQIFLRVKATGE